MLCDIEMAQKVSGWEEICNPFTCWNFNFDILYDAFKYQSKVYLHTGSTEYFVDGI